MVAFSYILTNKRGGTLYVGSTTDIHRRLDEHRSKAVPSFTRTYNLVRLVHLEHFSLLIEARHRERQLKAWRREWKIALIERTNPDWNDLAHFL